MNESGVQEKKISNILVSAEAYIVVLFQQNGIVVLFQQSGIVVPFQQSGIVGLFQ